MGGRWLPVAVAVLMLPQGALAWTQMAGGEDRPGYALLPPGPLDVVASYRLTGPGERINMWREAGLVETPDGVFGLAVTGDALTGDCTMFRLVDPRGGIVERGTTLRGCTNERSIVAYDPARELLLVCEQQHAEDPVLSAVDARTGAVRWAIRPARDLGVLPVGNPSAFGNRDIWYCSGAALDAAEGAAYMPFYSRTYGPPLRNRVAKLSLDTGKVDWWMTVPVSAFLQGSTQTPSEQYYYRPFIATLTDSGIALSGILGFQFTFGGQGVALDYRTPDNNQDAFQWAVAWTDREGNLRGGQIAEDDANRITSRAQGGNNVFAGSVWAASRGEEAATAIGDTLMLINPARAAILRSAGITAKEDLSGFQWWPATRWWDQTILVPFHHSVNAYEAESLDDRWSWTEGTEWRVGDTLIVPPGSVYVLASRNLTAGKEEAALWHLDLHSGRVLQQLPLFMRPRYTGGAVSNVASPLDGGVDAARWNARLQALGGGLVLAWDEYGSAALLGPAAASRVPRVEVPLTHPRLEEPVTLRFGAAPGAALRGYLVQWGAGEGPVEVVPAETGEATHRYTTAGSRVVRVTAVYADNSTATRELQLHPGVAPPARTNALVQAFQGDSRDTTWGVIGLLVALAGAAYGLWRRRRARALLGKELSDLQRIRALGRRDAPAALQELAAFRAQLAHDHTRGRLEPGPFQAIEARAEKVRKELHSGVAADLGKKVTPRFRRLFEAALEDGLMNDAEEKALLAGLRAEPALSEGERRDLAKLIRGLA